MKTITFLLMILTSFFSLSTFAGLSQPADVIVDMENMSAQGDMISARYSKSDFTFIGCGIRRTVVGEDVFTFGFWEAN